MRIDVITLFPELVQTIVEYGVTSKAQQKKCLELTTWNPREFTGDRHQTVDDRPYGGGPGMVMKYQPLKDSLAAVKRHNMGPVICLTPQGKVLGQKQLNDWAKLPELVLIAGRYEGLDERFVTAHIDMECSLGDYVISGGELAAMIIIDGLARLQPTVLGNSESANQDSFMTGLLDYPHYTRPEEIESYAVPKVLMSGHHQQIAQWRLQQALGRTWLRRPDLLEIMELDENQLKLLEKFKQEWFLDKD